MTREELEVEIAEKTQDLAVFTQALELMRARAQHSEDYSKSQMPMHNWAGATGLIDIATVVVHNMERVLEELKAERATAGPPTLRVVKGEADEQVS